MPIKHILVVDDSPTDRRYLSDILAKSGYSVTTAESAEEAFAKVKLKRPDLVLMDVVMPGLSCREAVQKIREACPDLPILLSSGYTAGEAVTELVSQTGLEILRKPYDPDQMLLAIEAALGRDPSSRA